MYFMLLLLLPPATTGVPVAIFQPDGAFTKQSFMMYRGSASVVRDPLPEITYCFRVKLFRQRGYSNYVLTYAIDGFDNALTAGL